MGNEIDYKNLIGFHPGSYVEDIIDDLNITRKEFARQLGISEKNLSRLVNGEDNLSEEMAYRLSELTGISVNTWMNLQNEYEKRNLIIHPGETLKEMLEDKEMSQRELAKRTGVTESYISNIVKGKKPISVLFAKKLEYALGVDARFWINLQSNYEKEEGEF